MLALTEYFGIPFNMPQGERTGVVKTPQGGPVNLRTGPSTDSPVIITVPNGSRVTVYADVPGWYVVNYNGVDGYISRQYIVLS